MDAYEQNSLKDQTELQLGYASMFYFSGPNTPFVNTNTAIGVLFNVGKNIVAH